MSFTIQIEPTGHTLIANEHETILDAAIRQGVGLPYGCRNGQCGSCICRLLEGEVTYPNGNTVALEEETVDACLTCQAIPQSDLVIFTGEIDRVEQMEVRIMPCRVESREALAHDVMRLWLKLPDNQRLQFMAGQYLDIILPDGRHRAFSIANAPHDDDLIELHIRHVDGGEFTDFVFSEMKERAILRIQAPLGSFTLRENSIRPMIFVAGGTGFAPIKGLIEHALFLGINRPIKIYWGARAMRDLYLDELPRRWAAEQSLLEYIPVLSEPDETWGGRTGWVHEAVLADHLDLSNYDIYMAGPPAMVKAGRDSFVVAGANPEHIYYDAFEYGAKSDA